MPAALETVAQQYTVQTNIIVTQQSNVNPIGPTLTVIPEPRLDANSATAWYLSADPGQIDTIRIFVFGGPKRASISKPAWASKSTGCGAQGA